jgi:peroxiredoxin
MAGSIRARLGTVRPMHLPLLVLLGACTRDVPEGDAPEDLLWQAPDNRWPSATPPADLVGVGFDVGEVVPDVRLRDQHGDEVSLWQFHGRVVLVTISAVWCLPCHELAEEAEAVLDRYPGEEVVLLTVLEEDAGGLSPEVADAATWADTYGADSPVLVDPEHRFGPALSGQFPSILAIDRDLVVAATLGGVTADDLEDLIESEL